LLENSDSTKELANIAVLVDNFNQVLDNLDNLIKSEKPELREIIKNIRNLSENLEYLSEHLKDNPSELIFSSPPPKQEK
jgi:phospholipid/cholesterol/gamma-HCH transport system substrate-binding protein/paraquat-inducible protein B